ncbi:helix-turn-helix domain-containing protein [Phenylobacterium sp.]|uniref:helix-turn-helix domain-containing protein n=1 Tax=Phenylobacterium sp. TaxID=1871053 RepID=UPI0025F77FF2|nr:helix-turn-helix transcriptional regulator [Phenylobacterium sp.]MBX3482408.1 helix-turn-helix transcriptional regulator [Phenylobacterium sp.]MCW5758202.1 helix-turn-helix transcriptional regulator [Phenylobacterium sp.]
MDFLRHFAANLRRERKAKGWSQEELAEQAGVDRTYVSGIERAVRNPTITNVKRLADALGVSIGTLAD